MPVFGVGEQDGHAYYVMQFIDGLALDEVLKELRQLRPASDHKRTAINANSPQLVAARDRAVDCAVSATAIADRMLTGQFAPTMLGATDGSNESDLSDRSVKSINGHTANQLGSRDTGVGSLADTRRDVNVTISGSSESSQTRGRNVYWESVARIGIQVAQALEYAHSQGVIHRDIKPANLLLDIQGTTWITDFGLAKSNEQQNLTRTGDVLGTLRYMAPEQLEGKADVRSDIYSLGLTLYEMLALKPGFGQLDRHHLIKQVTECTPLRLRTLNPSVPRDLETIVHKAIEREPSHRYQTAQKLADDLKRFQGNEPIRAKWVSPVTRAHRWCKRNPMGAAVTLLLVLLAISGPFVAAEQVRLRRAAEDATNKASERADEVNVQRKEALFQAQLAHRRATEAEQATRLAKTQESLARQQRDLTLKNLYAAHVRLAHEDWNTGHLARMDETLDFHFPKDDLPDFRGWEWYYLASLARQHEDEYRPGLGAIQQVKWSPDGKWVSIAGRRGVQILEPVSQQVVQSWLGHQAAEWSADGTRFATVKRDPSMPIVKVLSTENWEELFAITTERSNAVFTSLTSTANGRSLAWITGRAQSSIWNQGDEKPTSFSYTPNGRFSLSALAWDPQGRYLAIGTQHSGRIGIWDSTEKKLVKNFRVPNYGITHISWSADGRRFATSSISGDISVWDVAGEPQRKQVGTHHGQAFHCDWSPDEQQIVSVGEDNLIRISNTQSGQQIRRFPGHRAHVQSVDWSPLGDRIVSGCMDGSVRFWQPLAGPDALSIPGILCIAWSPDGTRIVTHDPPTDKPVTLSVRDSRSGQVVTGLEPSGDVCMFALAWSSDGKLIAGAGGFGGQAIVWDAKTGRRLYALDAHRPETRGIAWSPDNLQFASCGMDRTVKIWETSTGKLLREFSDHAQPLGSVRWSPDGRWFASVDWHRNVNIRSTESWEIEWELDLDRSPVGGGAGGDYMIAWSPDSQRLAAVQAAGEIVVSRLQKGKTVQLVWSAQAHTSNIRSLAWSPNGQRIASASQDRSVKIWDADSGRELLVLDDHAHMVTSVTWSPDGRRLASTEAYDFVHIWDATSAYQD